MKCPKCGVYMKGTVCDCGYIASLASSPATNAIEALVCQYCGRQGKKIKGEHKDKQGKIIAGWLNGELGEKTLCFYCYQKYYANKRGFYHSGKLKEDKDQQLYLMALFYGEDIAKPCWCPMCNRKIYVGESFCYCGWKINPTAVISEQCPADKWEEHKKFVDEYRYMKENGLVKDGYDYFKQKVGNTGFGKMIVKQVEHKYTKANEDAARLANLSKTMPSEWQ